MINLDLFLESCHGVIDTRAHRSRSSTLSRWVRQGRLLQLLPGILVAPGTEAHLPIRLRAVALWAPGAIVCEDAAAWLTYWPDRPVEDIVVALDRRRASRPGVRIVERMIPPEYRVMREGLTLTHPVLTAIDLADRDHGALIDDLLRMRRVTVDHVERALSACAHRAGNPARRRVVARSRTNPWSRAEREYHDLLDSNGVTGWVANLRVVLDGVEYWLDIAFERERLALEVDGFEHHGTWQAFQDDRRRQNRLVAHGWRVVRFTWAMLADPAYVLATIAAVRRGSARGHPA